MKKWKKLLLPAMCVFMLQTPVIANAEVAGSSDGAAAVVENPVAAPTPALLNGIIKKGSKTYYYKDGVMQKNCWSADKKQYFGKNGVAYAAPKESGYKKNVVVKKIGKKYYGFDRNGYKVKKGVYADLKGTPYYFDKNGVRVAKKSSQLKKASKYMENGSQTSWQTLQDQILFQLYEWCKQRYETDICKYLCITWKKNQRW